MGKPTGVSGFIQVQVNPDGTVTGGFQQIPYSKDKEEVEITVAHAFIRSINREMNKTGEQFFISNPRSNPENDFDLTVSGSRGEAYLEMREIQPGIPYDQAPNQYYSYEFARVLLNAIQVKSEHYAHPGRELFLLLYSTHWAFHLNETVLMCLRYWLAQDKPLFDAIFTYDPLDSNEGDGHWVFPYPPELLGEFDPETVRDHWCIKLDPRKGTIISG